MSNLQCDLKSNSDIYDNFYFAEPLTANNVYFRLRRKYTF